MVGLQRFRRCALMFVAVAALLMGGCGPDNSGQKASTPKPPAPPVAVAVPSPPLVDWKPDPALLDQLESYQDVEGYEIRLPKGCKPTSVPMPYGKIRVWQTPMRDDNTQFMLAIMLVTVPPGVSDYALTAEQELDSILIGFKKTSKFSDWQQAPTESGQVGGVPFVRVCFQGVVNGVKGYGSYYVTKNAGTFVAISIVDFEPHSKESLGLGKASILTFRKK
jgi:hypothetical protein